MIEKGFLVSLALLGCLVPMAFAVILPEEHQPSLEEIFQNLKTVLNSSFYGLTETDVQKLALYMIKNSSLDEEVSTEKYEGIPLNFSCPKLPVRPNPRSVHDLKPGDIKVVMALGDSITAGFAAKSTSLLDILNEARGIAWNIGADEHATTLTNFLTYYNPNVVGGSIKTGFQNSPNSKLNVAVSGAIASDMPTQARELIRKLKEFPGVDMQNDWKMLSIWIGGNDLCSFCKDQVKHSAKIYKDSIKEALNIIRTEVPRVFVNLINSIDVTELDEFREGTCATIHTIVCPCVNNEENKELLRDILKEYHKVVDELEVEFKELNLSDFAVVVQPFLTSTNIPDRSYLSAGDCFHPSLKGHGALAIGLWNSLLYPVGKKPEIWTPGEEPLCPRESDFFYTDSNSRM